MQSLALGPPVLWGGDDGAPNDTQLRTTRISSTGLGGYPRTEHFLKMHPVTLCGLTVSPSQVIPRDTAGLFSPSSAILRVASRTYRCGGAPGPRGLKVPIAMS